MSANTWHVSALAATCRYFGDLLTRVCRSVLVSLLLPRVMCLPAATCHMSLLPRVVAQSYPCDYQGGCDHIYSNQMWELDKTGGSKGLFYQTRL